MLENIWGIISCGNMLWARFSWSTRKWKICLKKGKNNSVRSDNGNLNKHMYVWVDTWTSISSIINGPILFNSMTITCHIRQLKTVRSDAADLSRTPHPQVQDCTCVRIWQPTACCAAAVANTWAVGMYTDLSVVSYYVWTADGLTVLVNSILFNQECSWATLLQSACHRRMSQQDS